MRESNDFSDRLQREVFGGRVERDFLPNLCLTLCSIRSYYVLDSFRDGFAGLFKKGGKGQFMAIMFALNNSAS